MPSNIEHANISAIKLGTADVTSGYIGHEQVFPNSREIASGVYTNTSQVPGAASAHYRYFLVTGEVGAEYSLNVTSRVTNASSSGPYNLTPVNGNYVLTSPTKSHILSFSDAPCGSSVTNVANMTLTPTGLTTIAGGASSITGNLTQGAGDPIVNWNPTWSWSITNTNRVTVVQNGVTKWAQGSTWTVNITSNALPTSVPNFYVNTYFTFGSYTSMTPNQSKLWQRGLDGNSYNMTWTVTQGSTPMTSHSPNLNYGTAGCYRVNNSTSSQYTYGGTLYP